MFKWINHFRSNSFYYKSIELIDYEVTHFCNVIKIIDTTKVLVAFDPPLPSHIYGVSDDIVCGVLVPRYKGLEYFPVFFQKSMIVNLCIAKGNGSLESGPWAILDIGEVFCTE